MKKLLATMFLALAACSTAAPATSSPTRAPIASDPDTSEIQAKIERLHQDTADVAARLAALHDALAQKPAKRPHRTPVVTPPSTDPDPHHTTITVDPSCPLCR